MELIHVAIFLSDRKDTKKSANRIYAIYGFLCPFYVFFQ